MAISFIAHASAHASSGHVSITHGLTILEGDVLIAVLSVVNTGSTFASDDSEFTDDYQDAFADGNLAIMSRVAGASEPSDYSWTISPSAVRHSVIIKQFRGVDSSVYDVAPAAGNHDENGGDLTLPSITQA